ncbi:MAG: hypothetical protein A2836_00375 [Candidatus Taylorbacteria bacterium RIFCSPHIGHO2_01_FULL_45_63]|uniref:Uncharacterized protein n=1 Tax=Candidatus Taylorbacteria bacterium RIFCSPHIGHO2_02_FULL_45_35 TaxID=1802311 RepID=A0A1G2MSL7_9BACT|nr:MAG: hypothetical protein A2836_00375 [Candidatus Taylorbacteria bacterium RIFCSPHIGHO2_01_FULL_45_63]OHA26825.1 MAG: hypothetical protein A3D56_02760 [Candidatus Taylorbacteria bacterium RIFCSPHIGHO2_02_FULL_45_35]OHA33614.1 MAG: hypothetical protein A3A22_03395 [Candidatus Taylorbacteria bacterium RIFCSPLOWO2_01_FULL_45_34b]
MELQNYSVPKKSPAASYTEKIHLNEFKNPPFFYFIWLYTFLFVCGKIILQYFLYTRTGGLSWPDGLYKAYLTVGDLPSELVSDLPYISLIIYAALFSTTAYNQGFKTALKSAIHLWFIILIVSIVPFFGLFQFLILYLMLLTIFSIPIVLIVKLLSKIKVNFLRRFFLFLPIPLSLLMILPTFLPTSFDQCKTIGSEQKRDGCYYYYAVQFKNGENVYKRCLAISNSQIKDSCLYKTFAYFGTIGVDGCEAISLDLTKQKICYTTLAIKKKDLSFCDKIKASSLQQQCITEFSREQTR